jgi:hypothetical protein
LTGSIIRALLDFRRVDSFRKRPKRTQFDANTGWKAGSEKREEWCAKSLQGTRVKMEQRENFFFKPTDFRL